MGRTKLTRPMPKERWELVMELWNYARKIASRFNAGFSVDYHTRQEMMSEATVGLSMAAESWEEDKGASFKSYATMIVIRRMYELYGNDSKHHRMYKNKPVSMIYDDGTDDGIDVSFPDPLDRHISVDASRELACHLLDNLSPDMKEMMLLAYRDGLSNRDIANRLHLSVTQVKSRRDRGLRCLRTYCNKNGLKMPA